MLQLRLDEGSPATVLSVTGEVDMLTAPGLEMELQRLATGARSVVVNLGDVEYFDLSGVRALEAGQRAMRAHHLTLALVGSSYPVHRVLELAGIGEMVPVFATLEEATRFVADGG